MGTDSPGTGEQLQLSAEGRHRPSIFKKITSKGDARVCRKYLRDKVKSPETK